MFSLGVYLLRDWRFMILSREFAGLFTNAYSVDKQVLINWYKDIPHGE